VFLNHIVLSILKRIRGRDIPISPQLSPSSVFVNCMQRGMMPFLRGLRVRPFLGAVKGVFFLGKGCRILNKRLLRVGKNVYIGGYGYLDCLSSGGVTFGSNVTLRENCWLQLTSRYDIPGESITIGNNVYIGPRAVLGAAAPLVIGDYCQFGANVSFIAENHNFDGDGDIHAQGMNRKGITVERDVWIGNNVTVLDGVTIGEGSVIGAGTVLTKSVPPRSVVVGVPGRVLRNR